MVDSLGDGLYFVLGLPRSGTTLLSVLLRRHPRVLAPAEPWLMLALEQIGQVCLRHPANSQLLGSAVRKFQGQVDHLRAARAYALTVYNEWLGTSGKTRFVDKTPRYYLIIDYLRAVFPRARFIVLLRNPLDIAASYKSSWKIDFVQYLTEMRDTPENFDLIIGLARLDRLLAEAPSDMFHVVHYESLVADPASVMVPLLRFLNVEPDEDRSTLTADFGPMFFDDDDMGDRKILTTQSVHQRSIESWRRVFNAEEAAFLVDAIGRGRISNLHYDHVLEAFPARSPNNSYADKLLAVMERHLNQRIEDVETVSTTILPLDADVQANNRKILAAQFALSYLLPRPTARSEPEPRADLTSIVKLTKALQADHFAQVSILSALRSTFEEVEADQNARFRMTRQLIAQLEEDEGGPEQRNGTIERLAAHLQEVESDRKARNEKIVALARQLEEIQAYRVGGGSAIDNLMDLLKESDADRAAQLQVIETLGTQIKESEADRVARLQVIETLGTQLKESEADRVARLQVIETLGTQLKESEADRVARLQVIETLGTQIKESEADRAARLHVIEALDAKLKVSDTDRAARLQVIETLDGQLRESEARRVTRDATIDLLRTQLQDAEERATSLERTAQDLTAQLQAAQNRTIRNRLVQKIKNIVNSL